MAGGAKNIRGTAEPNAEVKVTVGSQPTKTVTANASGAWSARFVILLPEHATERAPVLVSVSAKAPGETVSSTVQQSVTVTQTRTFSNTQKSLTEIRFTGCSDGTAGEATEGRFTFIVDTAHSTSPGLTQPGADEVKYELKAVACDGYNLPPTQTQDNRIKLESSLEDHFHSLNAFCKWQATFWHPNNCAFSVELHSSSSDSTRKAPEVAHRGDPLRTIPSALPRDDDNNPIIGSRSIVQFEFEGNRYQENGAAATSYWTCALGFQDTVFSLEITTTDDTSPHNNDCTSDIELNNISPAGDGKAVTVTFATKAQNPTTLVDRRLRGWSECRAAPSPLT